jgi:hypothetical protein
MFVSSARTSGNSARARIFDIQAMRVNQSAQRAFQEAGQAALVLAQIA